MSNFMCKDCDQVKCSTWSAFGYSPVPNVVDVNIASQTSLGWRWREGVSKVVGLEVAISMLHRKDAKPHLRIGRLGNLLEFERDGTLPDFKSITDGIVELSLCNSRNRV